MGALGVSWPKAGPLWLVSPRLEPWQKKQLSEICRRVPFAREMVWLLSSGSQSVQSVKCIGLTRAAIEASAEAVNKHLNAQASDRWLIAIPEYHIGGFAIGIRATLSKSRVFHLPKWNAKKFVSALDKNKISLTSLVPTQIYDLVSANLKSPTSLRAVVVGGGSLSPDLYGRARALGWPVLPSYGLTEAASQVATAELSSLDGNDLPFPRLKILSHLKARTEGGRLCLRGASLAQWIARSSTKGDFTLEVTCPNGWYVTEDLAEVTATFLKPLGRTDEVVKILGTLVALPDVHRSFEEFLTAKAFDFTLLTVTDARQENRLVLVTDTEISLVELEAAVDAYNRQSQGPRRIQQICWIPKIPRGELGKVKRAQLKADLHLI